MEQRLVRVHTSGRRAFIIEARSWGPRVIGITVLNPATPPNGCQGEDCQTKAKERQRLRLRDRGRGERNVHRPAAGCNGIRPSSVRSRKTSNELSILNRVAPA